MPNWVNQIVDWIYRAILYIGDPARLTALADLVSAIAALLWPLAIFLLLCVYRAEVRRVFQRLRKARVMGQEVELQDELSAVQQSVDAAAESVESKPSSVPSAATHPPGTSAGSRDPMDEVTEILRIAAQSPKAALMLLSSHIERRLRNLVSTPSDNLRTPTVTAMVQLLATQGRLPDSLAKSISSFLHVRSRVLHGGEATETEVIRAIDVGLVLLRTLNTL